MSKMSKKYKERWLKALRSGKYKKAVGQLRVDPAKFEEEESHFCCLGVLTDVVKEEVDGLSPRWGGDSDLPESVCKLTGIPYDVENDSIQERLISMNDGCDNYKRARSFKEIANWIEKNL